MTRYYTEIVDEVMRLIDAGEGRLPDGWRVVGPALGPASAHGTRWYEIEDDGAPAELEGKRVSPTFQERMVVEIIDRTVEGPW